MLIPDAADVMHISQAEGEQSVHSLIISDTTGVLVIQNRVTESEKGYKIDLILTVIKTIHNPDHLTEHQCFLLK